MQLETVDGKILAEIGTKEQSKMMLPGEDDSGGIEFDRSNAKEENEDEEESEEEKELDIDDI
jgi:hypothetical protein